MLNHIFNQASYNFILNAYSWSGVMKQCHRKRENIPIRN